MRKKISFLGILLFIALLFNNSVYGQKVIATGSDVKVVKAAYADISQPLTQMQPIKNWVKDESEVENHFRYVVQPNKGFKDPVLQTQYNMQKANANILQTIEGCGNSDNSSYVAPPDTQGDVGNNYYVQTINNVMQIWGKNGSSVWGPNDISTIWNGFNGDWTGTNDGDAVVLYDETADRWLISQFAVNGTTNGTQWELVAISTTNDPTGTYYRYAFEFPIMPDYPKLGVWQDGYYMGANGFDASGNYQYSYLVAMDRAAMLNGPDDNTPTMQYLKMDWSTDTKKVYTPIPMDCDGTLPAAGTPGYFVYDRDDDTYWSSDDLRVLAMDVDWANSSNTTLTETTINVSAYSSSFSASAPIDQPGTSQNLDALNDRMMFRAQFRKMTGHNSMVISRTVNTGSDIAGVRWYELRQSSDGATWSLYQEGTYAPGDGDSRWMSSIAMNANGDIALGYSVSGSSTYPSIRVTGRSDGDPLGQMTVTETSILAGTASQTATSGGNPVTRWGDYAMMSVDPSDNDFWFTTEYTTGDWGWKTKIAEFNFPSTCTPPSSQASNFSTSAIGDNQMTANWTRGNGNQVLVVAHEGSAVDANPTSGNTYTASSTFGTGSQIGTGNYVVYDGTGTNVTVTGLTAGTQYYFAVYEYFTADNCYNTTALTGNATTTGTAPCTPCTVSSATDDGTGVTGVVFNTISNTSSGTPEYTDNTNISTTVLQGQSYDLSVKVNTAGDWTVNVKAWIDWNQDCDFDDAGEEYDLGNVTNVTDNPPSGSPISITIPAGATLGSTTMRIRATYDVAPISCGNQDYSEAEDYTIDVTSSTSSIITVTENSLDFGSVGLGYYRTKTYDVSGSNLTNDITITGTSDFQVSTDGTTFSPSVVLTQSGGTVNTTTITVKFTPDVAQSYSGTITNVSSGATQQDVACTGKGVQWFFPPTNLTGSFATGTNNVNLTWNAPNTSASSTNWYEYADVASATSYNSGAYEKRVVYFKADELSYTYPIKITQLRTGFYDDGNWTNTQFKFVVYGEDLSTKLYESPILNADQNSSTSTYTYTLSTPIIITGDFFVGVEPVASDGSPFNLLKKQADNNYHSYAYDGSNWYYFSDGTNAYDIPQGVYVDGAKGGKWLTNSTNSNAELSQIKIINDKIILISNSQPKSILSGYRVYKDGTQLGADLPATTTSYTDNSVCGSHKYYVTAFYTGYDGESDSIDVTLNYASPSITSQPSSTSKCVGDNVTFTVVATGDDLTYQWKKGGSNISGATSASYTISGIVSGDAGSYTCVVTNACSAVTSNAATLTVNEATAITAQPSSATKCEGDNVSFSVTATGSNLTYQWKKGGTNISGAISASYSITGIVSADAGSYTCVVSGDCGSPVTSNTATLTVNDATVITTQPSSAAKCEGDNVSFSVTATGSNLTYQWKKGGTNISGATSATYSITGIVSADAGSYTCVVTGDCGNVTSNTAILTINDATAITAQPSSATKCEGDNVSFSVTATGSNLTYQWKKDGVAISGATSATYTISGIVSADAANYTCDVTGDCGVVTSNAASLTINPATVITSESGSQTACDNSNVTFSVTATGSNLTYQWKKDGSVISGATSDSYTISGATNSDEGTYTCVVTGDCGSVISSNMTLTITASMTVGDPANANVCPADTAKFTVTANGTNTTYQWKKDGVNMSNGGDISGVDTKTLMIVNCDATDEATYSCYVTSDCGNATSNGATLTLNTATAITSQPVGGTKCEGENITFSIVATGSNLTYQWKKNGVAISGATSDTYTLTNLSSADAATYTCDVTGDCGTITSNAVVLTVNANTGITTQPQSQSVCSGTDVTFSVVATGSNLSYQWKKDNTDISGATSDTYLITGATSAEAGDYVCIVTGDCGNITSDTVTLTISTGAAITTQPQNQTACTNGTATFTVVATGDNLSYQWRKDGNDISGEISASLTLNSVTSADEGSYTCIVSSACGSDTSDVATLMIVSSTSITTQPQNQSVCDGGNATFTVVATGSNKTYQWKKAGSDITGATSDTYTITGVSSADLADYTCYVTSDCGNATSDAATLTMLPATQITTQPIGVSNAQIGDTLVFTVIASGSNLAYQWFKDTATITGANVNTYTINGVVADDAGSYYAIVSGDCGQVISDTAMVTVVTDLNTIVELGMKVYPNPVDNGRFTVSFDNIKSNYEMKIYDATGRMIYYGNLNENFNKINLGQQTSGVYVMKIYNDDISRTVKLIIK